MLPRPGEIYWAALGGRDPRPVIVVSREQLNRGDYVVVVPLTTSRIEERRELQSCVAFRAGEFSLPKECVAQGDAIAQLNLAHLDLVSGPLGTLDDVRQRELIRAIGHVISAECEPE